MNELNSRFQGIYAQVSVVVQRDIAYIRDVWSGEVPQGNANQINDRNARLTLMFVRAITGTYMTYLTFATLKALVKLPCMSAFSFLDDVLPIFLKVVVSHNLVKTSLNLANSANLNNGIVAGYLAPPLEQEDRIAAVNPYVAETIFPSIWNSFVLYCLNEEEPAQIN